MSRPAPTAPTVAAPGKLFLAGEYAVLEGAPAVLAAAATPAGVATARFEPGQAPTSAVIAAATTHARAALAACGLALPEGAARVDTTAFLHEGVKLGLGSSAAAAVTAVAAAFVHGGLVLADQLPLLRATADAAHRVAQGGVGSGGDIAASVHGGFLRFARAAVDGDDGEASATAVTPLDRPAGLTLVTFWTRSAARTPDFISGVRRFAAANPAAHRQRMAELATRAGRFADVFARDPRATVHAAAAYGEAMAALGRDAALPIVIPAVAHAAALAVDLGGAAKPSGAGGGDMGIAFFAEKAAAEAFAARCPEGVLVLDIRLGVAGATPLTPLKPLKED